MQELCSGATAGWMPSPHLLLEIGSILHFSPNWKYSRTSFQVFRLHSRILQMLLGWRPASEMPSHKHQTLLADAFVIFSQSRAPRAQPSGRPVHQLIYIEGNGSYKRLQRPSSISSALRIPVNSSVRYKISHWFGFSSCCVLFTSQPSLLPAASSLSSRTAPTGRCSGLRDREVGMLRAAGPATPGLPTPEKLCLFSLSMDED